MYFASIGSGCGRSLYNSRSTPHPNSVSVIAPTPDRLQNIISFASTEFISIFCLWSCTKRMIYSTLSFILIAGRSFSFHFVKNTTRAAVILIDLIKVSRRCALIYWDGFCPGLAAAAAAVRAFNYTRLLLFQLFSFNKSLQFMNHISVTVYERAYRCPVEPIT